MRCLCMSCLCFWYSTIHTWTAAGMGNWKKCKCVLIQHSTSRLINIIMEFRILKTDDVSRYHSTISSSILWLAIHGLSPAFFSSSSFSFSFKMCSTCSSIVGMLPTLERPQLKTPNHEHKLNCAVNTKQDGKTTENFLELFNRWHIVPCTAR